jgi:Uma2 family endonuclease
MTTEPREITDLIAALDHPDKPTIRAAVDQLIALAETSETLRQALHNRLSEADHRNYWPVAYILGHQAQPSGVVIRTLLDALDHREPDIRWANGLLLVRIAQQEGAVVPLLVELCVTGSANQKRMALYCLRDLALHDAESRRAMLMALDDEEPTVRVAAATSLKVRTDVDAAVRQKLLATYLQDADDRVKNVVAVTLASLGSPDEEFMRALNEASRNGNGQIKKSADSALKMLQK